MSFILRMYQFTVAIPTILFCAYIPGDRSATVNKVRIIFFIVLYLYFLIFRSIRYAFLSIGYLIHSLFGKTVPSGLCWILYSSDHGMMPG